MIKVGILKKEPITNIYVEKINNHVCGVLGPKGKPKLVLDNSVDSISSYIGTTDDVIKNLVERSWALVEKGASAIVIPHNGLNIHADAIAQEIGIKVIRPADAIAKDAQDLSIERLGLIGTEGIMKSQIIKGVLEQKGISVVIPSENEMEIINNIIYNILMKNNQSQYPKAIEECVRIVNELTTTHGIRGIALGCTELSKILDQNYFNTPVLDSVECHVLDVANEILDSVTYMEALGGGMNVRELIKLRQTSNGERILKLKIN